VKTHRERIMRKLNLRGVADLTRFAIAQGIVPLQKAVKHSRSKVAHPARFDLFSCGTGQHGHGLANIAPSLFPLTSGSLKSLNKIEALAAEKVRA
jgi:hypothetical protein